MKQNQGMVFRELAVAAAAFEVSRTICALLLFVVAHCGGFVCGPYVSVFCIYLLTLYLWWELTRYFLQKPAARDGFAEKLRKYLPNAIFGTALVLPVAAVWSALASIPVLAIAAPPAEHPLIIEVFLINLPAPWYLLTYSALRACFSDSYYFP